MTREEGYKYKMLDAIQQINECVELIMNGDMASHMSDSETSNVYHGLSVLNSFSHNFMDLTGYGETKEQAMEDFKRKFRYLLDEWNAFAKRLLDSDIAENEMIEVDCFGEPIDKKGEKP